MSSNVEENQGPKRFLTICHWNLNGIAVHNFIKIALLKAYLNVHEMGIICLSETFLDSSAPNDADNLQIPGTYKREVWHYKLATSDCIQRTIKNFD